MKPVPLGSFVLALVTSILPFPSGDISFAAELRTFRPPTSPVTGDSGSGQKELASVGQRLFLKNCAHCHGADGHGDEGPDLHNLDWNDEQIAVRIRNGKKGQMPAFAGKFTPNEIKQIIVYLRTLK